MVNTKKALISKVNSDEVNANKFADEIAVKIKGEHETINDESRNIIDLYKPLINIINGDVNDEIKSLAEFDGHSQDGVILLLAFSDSANYDLWITLTETVNGKKFKKAVTTQFYYDCDQWE